MKIQITKDGKETLITTATDVADAARARAMALQSLGAKNEIGVHQVTIEITQADLDAMDAFRKHARAQQTEPPKPTDPK